MSFIKKTIDEYLYRPMKESELKNLVGDECNVITYKDFTNYNTLADLFKDKKNCILLVEWKENFGHWVLLMDYQNSIEFFDPYGYFPDDQLKEIDDNFREQKNMVKRHLANLLYASPKLKYFSQYTLQNKQKEYDTCGYWCCVRLALKKLDENEFYKLIKQLKTILKVPDFDHVSIILFFILYK